MKQAKILFFIDGPAPTAKEFAEAQALPAQVMFRNAQHVPADGCLEECDGVMGEVPARYEEKYEDAQTAISRIQKAAKEASEALGDAPAPKKNSKTQQSQQQPQKGPNGEDLGPDGKPIWKPNA